MNKVHARKRRGLKAKAVIAKTNRPRLVVNRSAVHIYAQIVARGEKGDQVIVSCSTLDKALKATLSGNKTEQALLVGKHLAERAKEQNVVDVAFDRSGYKYHGRIKALATGAREAGLNF
jgi:large subunit ribosomal protein L18